MGTQAADITARDQVLVVGGGRFGQLAVSSLPGRILAVVEPEPSAELLALGVPVLRQDGPQAVAQVLAGPEPPGWIAPCLPRHLLVEWLRLSLAPGQPRLLPIPPDALPELPLAARGPQQSWLLSLTDTICPAGCPEPADTCLKTGLPRGQALHERLAGIRLPGWGTAVLASHQLAPGVGALASREMLDLRERLAREGGRWLVATACRCHGVLQALELDPVGEAAP